MNLMPLETALPMWEASLVVLGGSILLTLAWLFFLYR